MASEPQRLARLLTAPELALIHGDARLAELRKKLRLPVSRAVPADILHFPARVVVTSARTLPTSSRVERREESANDRSCRPPRPRR